MNRRIRLTEYKSGGMVNWDIYIVSQIFDDHNTGDPFEICDNLGIRVEYIGGVDTFSGMLICLMGQFVILINRELSEQVQKLICAHELGHYFLHSESMAEGYLEEFEIFEMNDKKEYEANVFAAHLLIDDDEMLDNLKEGYSVFETSMQLNVNPILLNIKMTDLNRMGYNFPTNWSDTKLFY